MARVVLLEYGVIEYEVAFRGRLELALDLLPDQARGDFVAFEIAVYGVMAPFLSMFGEVGKRVVDLTREQEDLTREQELAVVESGKSFGTVGHRLQDVPEGARLHANPRQHHLRKS